MPPSVVPTISPVPVIALPTAKHTVVLGQAMLFRATLSDAGGVWAAHVEPPLVVAMTVDALLVPPTAKQTVALGQSTSLSWGARTRGRGLRRPRRAAVASWR